MFQAMFEAALRGKVGRKAFRSDSKGIEKHIAPFYLSISHMSSNAA
jgi:hypothetical protein